MLCLVILRKYCHICNQRPHICPIGKFRVRIKMPNFGTKNAFIELFLGWSFKKLLSYLKSMPSYFNVIIFETEEFVLLQSLVQKFKKNVTKSTWFWFFGVGINLVPWGILKPYFRLPLTAKRCTGDEVWLEFENNIILLEINTL